MNNEGHDYFMQRCIELAKIAKSNGESPVGAIIVKDGVIIGEGIEAGKAHLDISFHAEIEALRSASQFLQTQDLSGCVLYTTHEPCIMCAYMIRHTKISEIIAAIITGEYGGFSSGYPLLSDTSIQKWGTPPKLVFGILESECRDL
ncbi:nucleoside deaminase [Dyadobacter psychrotolerans]|uniref:Nucleoside deaminase n=1 Tax=Dyadobacter psychrotolerans TaxID=2541721 RepID=A0A4R5DTY8_9BACT|nr:nucleoside deaminase [Dyadobacter psychrotolerans]TDE15571.1 nucleoside deaminase [Dyadobacter psychrotolerans]